MMGLIVVVGLALGPAAAPPAADDPAPSLEGLQQVYDQSCAAREFGTYDDVCNELAQQLRKARSQAARDARRRPAAPRPAPPSTPAPSPSGQPAVTPTKPGP